MVNDKGQLDRRQFLKASSGAAAAWATGLPLVRASAGQGCPGHASLCGKKMIVLAMDGMDPLLTERMMDAGALPNFEKLRRQGGYRRLATSVPAQTPVAFGNFITGSNPGVHGIFDFMHRLPENQFVPFLSVCDTKPGKGFWEIGDHRLQLSFWPFNHVLPETQLHRGGVPFWDYLDEAGIASWIYEIPSNYPPSPSKHGWHRCVAGLGTPDMLGTYGTYQHFASDGPHRARDEGGGRRSRLRFKKGSAVARLVGPDNTFLKKPKPSKIDFLVHRDSQANAVMIEIQGRRMLLAQGEWSPWIKLDFILDMPSFLPDEHLSGICRFYVQQVTPACRVYVTPINIDPSSPAVRVSEPDHFIKTISDELGLFYTAGFQEDHKALSNKVFTDEDYAEQCRIVLDERIALLDHAIKHFDDGLLFFYFAATDLQAHMFWWDSDEPHPLRSPEEARRCHQKVEELYRTMDRVVGEVLARNGDEVMTMVFSDHGFANFKRQFNLNTWLRDNGYIQPDNCQDLPGMYPDRVQVDWSTTRAYGLGLNGLYLNLRGRERYGIVSPGQEKETLLCELVEKLEAVRDTNGRRVIDKVYRGDEVYKGSETRLAPDLIVGYARDYRSSWATSLGEITEEVLADNPEAWAASHCMAAEAVPGVLFCNRTIRMEAPQLIDLAPTILAEFGLRTPATMEGQTVFTA